MNTSPIPELDSRLDYTVYSLISKKNGLPISKDGFGDMYEAENPNDLLPFLTDDVELIATSWDDDDSDEDHYGFISVWNGKTWSEWGIEWF